MARTKTPQSLLPGPQSSNGGSMLMEPTPSQRAIICIQYGVVSVSITLFNRAVFSVYQFNFPAFVTLIQLLVSILYIYTLKYSGRLRVGALTIEGARRVAPLALFWWLYVVSGVTALRFLNVPMYSVLRRSTTLVVVAGEYLAFHKVPTGLSLMGLGLMTGGAIVAGLSDVTFNLAGYLWVAVCVFSTATYLLLIRKLKDTGMNQHTLLLYNNVLALPLMLGMLLLGTNELAGVAAYPRLADPRFLVFLLVSCSQAFLLNVCIFRCTLVNSALATNVSGQVKDILTTALGATLFSDVPLRPLNALGLALGLLGSTAYSYISYREANPRKVVVK
ncbi:hypothetical protein ACKKBG_A37200 [Auxenochlorella protothecoides x Auxenochlorella symbiontica]